MKILKPAKLLTEGMFLLLLFIVAVMDGRTRRIPDGCQKAIWGLAGISCLTVPEIALISRTAGALGISLPLLLLALVIPGSIGGGDVKLMASCGAFLGWERIFTAAEMGFFCAGVWGMGLLLSGKGKRNDNIALGSFLCLGMATEIVVEHIQTG